MSRLRNFGRTRALWHAVVLVLVSSFPTLAQVASGVITGTVTDQQDAAVQGATVTVRQTDQQLTRTAQTNELGRFEVPLLPVGPYTVEAVSDGFKKSVRTDLTLTTGQTMRVDFRLEVGSVQQEIEVRADATQALRTETSEIGQVITHSQVADLPLNGRNFDDLIPLNAGVTDGMQNASNSGYNINGSRSDNNMFLINGVDNLNGDNNLSIRPPIDAIEEFQILTSTFSAEYGRTAGGVVTVQLKSGTNEFHGSLFEFFRNEKLDANSFFDNQVPLGPGQDKARRQPLRRNQFGGTIGGPIVRNKTFFFVDYQGLRDINGRSTIQSVPTALERQGDFSQTLAAEQSLFENALLGTVFPNKQIPQSAMDAPAIALTEYYPLPNQAGLFIPGQGTINNFSTAGSLTNNSDQFDVKIDHRFGEKDSLAGHYNFVEADTLTPAAFGPVGPCVNCGVVLDLLAGATDGRSQNFGLTEVHTFSPNTINEVRIGVNRSAAFFGTSDGGQNLSDQIGIPNVNLDDLTTGLPWFLFSPGPSWIGTSPFTPFRGGFTAYQLTENLTHIHGRHSLKFGFDFRRRHDNGSGNFFGKGAYIMVPFYTGNSFGDFLTGRALVIQQDLTLGTRGIRMHDYGFYVQDDFKVSRKLTLNLGLRYDIFPGHTEVADRMSNLDINTGIVTFAGVDGPRNFVETDKNNLGPRIGFAYAIDDKTAIRGGYGVAYFNPADQISQAGLNPPFTRAFNFFNIDFSTADAAYRFSDGLPIHLITSVEDYDKQNPTGSFKLIEPNSRTPYTQYFSFNIQRALPGNLVFDIGYVGTKGTKLPGEVELNPTPPGDPSNAEQRRIRFNTIPNVGGVTGFVNGFDSNFHSLQVKLEKRMSSGLQFLTTYTFSKSIDNKSGSSVTGGGDSNPSSQPHNPFDWSSDRSQSSFDRKHRFITAFNYELPVGQGKAVGTNWSPAVNALLGDWKLNGIVSLQNGLPFNVLASSAFTCGCSSGELRPDRIADGRLPGDERSVNGWFDKTAFADPPSSTAETPGRYGNAGRSIIPGPGYANIDFSVFKEFRIREDMRLQFRAEFFNLLNRANFLYPDTANANWQAGGIITRAQPGRVGQLALKLQF